MAANTSSVNLTTGYSNKTTEPHNSDFCPPFPGAFFVTMDSSVPYIVNASLNVPLAFATTFANLMVILAMRHITSIRLPSKLLLCSLVMTDLGAGLVVQPQFTVFLFMKGIKPYGIPCLLVKSIYIAGSLFSNASLLTMTVISLDRYAALFFHVKYQQIVTARRVCAVLTFIWSYSLCSASAIFWKKLVILGDIFSITSVSICFVVISMANIKIYRRLRSQHGRQIQPPAQAQCQQQTGNTLSMAMYKRTASVLLWIYALFILCYLPFLIQRLIFVSFVEPTALTQSIEGFSYTLVLLNSCLNPFVYCLRLPEIRTEVLKQLRKICCRSPQQQDAHPEDQQL